MGIESILETIKGKSLDEVKKEFRELYRQAVRDKSGFIRYSAKQIQRALAYRAEGKIGEDDVRTLLKKLKKLAQIEANSATIAVLSRIQKLIYRMLDLSIDVLAKAIVPMRNQ